ncbi:MAG TPA: hypothetical protein EYH22_01655 [Candidatus Nanopusillus sp.]|nr:hypothetical protein [Candidatus Nanopusillus sp.]
MERKTRVVKVDYDSKKLSNYFYINFTKLFANLWEKKGVAIKKIEVLESRKGFHIRLTLNKDITVEESLLFALMLYSDPIREVYNYCRYLWDKDITFNFFAKRKMVFFGDGRVVLSRERVTKRSRKLKRKLIRIVMEIEQGKCSKYLGKYF